MYLDNSLAVTTATAIDLEALNPGPGKPIKLVAMGVTLTVTVTDGATSAAADAHMVVTCGGADLVEFELPSTTQRYVKFTFADGEVEFVMDAQTAV